LAYIHFNPTICCIFLSGASYYLIMKMISDLTGLKKSSALGRNFAFVFVLIFTVLCFFTGCNKPSTAQAPTPQQPVADTNQASVAMPHAPENAPAPVALAASPDGGVDLKQLNHAYVGWIVRNRRAPNTFEEFVAWSGIQVPPPPAGKKYVIDSTGFINLVNN
jgi:hypothetical protein